MAEDTPPLGGVAALFEPPAIDERRAELHQLMRLRLRIMRRFDKVERSAEHVMSAAAELIKAAEPERPLRLPKAGWPLGL